MSCVDCWLGLTDLAGDVLNHPRNGMNTRHTCSALPHQSVYIRLAGYPDTNDTDQLRIDPAMRRVVGDRAKYHPAASTSQMGRFETPMLTINTDVALPICMGHGSIGSTGERG